MYKTVTKSEKVSDNIIAQIRDSILSGQLKPGDRLASEKELIEQFGVSKATMREALRVLEVMGLIEIRKGISGGAFVAEVDMRTTIHSIINFLHFHAVSIHEITMLRYIIEPTMAQMAAIRMTDRDEENLRQVVGEAISPGDSELSKEIGFHRYLARMAGNTISILIVDFIDNLLRSVKAKLNLGLEFYESVRDAHQVILECLIQKDPVAAGIAMRNDLLQVGRYLARIMGTRAFDPGEFQKDWTISDLQLSLDLNAQVVREGNPNLKQKGVFLRRVGDGTLYLVSGINGSDAFFPSSMQRPGVESIDVEMKQE
jgi:GntR family transcriptional regulator, transcriptional repressor for pyruvate dehydrogenase complex